MLTVKSDGTVEVSTPQEAADLLRLMNGHTVKKETAIPLSTEISDDNVVILLRAGGMKLIRESTKELYGFLLKNQHRAWTADEISKRINQKRQSIVNKLSSLARRKIVTRVGHAQYKAG